LCKGSDDGGTGSRFEPMRFIAHRVTEQR
jgi:hypothetical protein